MKKSTLGPQSTVDHTANKTIPSLGNNNTESPEPAPASDSIISGNVMQAGQILSSDNITNSSINYAKSVGGDLINQQINDWLNQKGTARVSVDSDSKLSGDMLLPIIGNNDSLLFTQLGMHGNEDRNTANLGLGYRQYIGAWMYGINTFYDYDYTGKNARLGVGGEAWTDYLKLAANSYYGLTGWHQSHLSDMEDYDERPANGFDLRAEAYLPSYPQLGANIKYEQYFGSGIDLGTGTDPDDLKDNPKALTVGLNYTPVPLITLKGEHSVGDKNESLIGLDVTYRFGVPWEQQISTDSVDTLRSLKGSMLEFVDRNYEIVMQYRKQDLLHISLPDNVSAKAAETIVLPLSVTKDKYGLKDVDWTASPAFIANGGTFRKLSLTQLEVKLPAYVYNQRTNAAQQYVIKAVGVDNNGNSSNTATTNINVAPSKNVISKLIISPSGSLPANDTDYFTVTAVVVGEQGQPMVAEAIKFNIDGIKDSNGQSAATLFKDGHSDGQELTANTDSLGKATIYVRSKLAKEGTITATMSNGNHLSGQLNFVTDTDSAQISDLEVINNNAPSDGQSTDKLKVTVKDGNNTPLANATVELSASHGAILVGGSTVVTDAEGQATVLVTNLTEGDTTITARINDSTKTQVITFVAGKSTATIAQGDLTTTQDAVANGIATNKITAKITDANGNTVSNVAVHFTVSNGAQITTVIGVTGDDGIATATVTSLKVETYTVTAQIQDSGNSAPVDTRFIADSSTATITDSNLTIDPNGALDNGVNTDNVEAIVTDANGNLVPNATVNFVVASGATIATVIGTTGTNGKATAMVTSSTSGKYAVTATVNGHSASKDAVFVADSGTATITSGDLKVTVDNALANGTAMDAVQAKVTDAHGNTVPNVTVNFTADHGAIVTTASAVTDVNGLASTTLSNTTSGTTNIVAAVNGTNQNVNTNFAPDDSTATIIKGNLIVTQNNAKANGTDSNKVQATVTDANGNPVPNTAVSFTADNGATVVTTSVTTDAQGLASTTLNNVKAGISKVTASVNGNNQTVDTTFVVDDSTATITRSNLTVIVNNAKANAVDINTVQAKVTDAQGNSVPNAKVSFTADNGAGIATSSATTDIQGLASTNLTNITAGVTKVTASINGTSQTVDTSFEADGGTSTIIDGNLTVTLNNAKANGSATNAVQAKVTDAKGNAVSNVDVNFSANNGATVISATDKTDTQGLATTTLTNVKAGTTKVTAAINGNRQMVDTTFVADDSTATITTGDLTVTVDKATANGTDSDKVQAKVTDATGNPVQNTAVNFTADNGATVVTASVTTNDQGLATTTLTNVKAGITKVTATANGKSQTVDTTFVADDSTATIVTGDLTVSVDKATANGANSNKVQAKVTDATGNPVQNTAVNFTADNGATVVTASVTTDDQGLATTTLTNVKAGITKVTATANGKSQTVDTTFVADDSTATIVTGDLTVTVDKATANGTDSDKVQAKVTDATGNPVPNTAVSFTADNGATVITASVTTDDQGLATTTLTNVKAGITKVTATANGKSQTVDTTFVADDSTATIVTGDLTVTVDKATANGANSNKVQAKVTDATGNPVPNTAVSFTADNGATVVTASVTTDDQGLASTTLTNITAGITKVTATANGQSQTVDTTFVADITTAAVTTVTLGDNVTDKIANGTDYFTYTAIVKDAHDNLVSNATVNWSQDKGNAVTLQAASSVTDVNGKASMVLTSTTTEALLVQVSASLTNGTVVNADKQVNFKQQLVEVHGATRNAVNGTIIPNVKIDFSLSENNANAEYSVTSDTDGKYKISIPQGIYQAKASATGFITLDSTLDIQTVTDLQHDFVLSPDLDGKAARIVLTWNKTPGDLDAILWVPSVDNPSKLIEVYYNAKSPNGADAKLDKDDQNGYGPETITIDSMHSGVYCYVVNNTFEGNSGAKVKLYLSDGTSQEFDVQDSTMAKWDNWTVFKIDTTSGQPKISTVNTFSNGSEEAQCH
ncbi:Ig-like domain-containing protein [Hafnia alvei]|uniref:Ig-like domain-containing protein n=1 Tax=Hafnia alvei TaxID=569 RepID=UPI00164262F9|nr:Ig-like domain-containing protein [Hafnia alvei]MBI0275158.1 Ig-like domain-containing protein [Hafnia alvei]